MNRNVKRIDEFLDDDNKNSIIEVSFSTNSDYSKATYVLSNNNYLPLSFSPPLEDVRYYKSNDHWKVIEFKPEYRKEIESILKENNIPYKVTSKNPMKYVIFNHGGYLD